MFISQDKTVQAFNDIEILQTDQLLLVSDKVENMFRRLDLTNAKSYYHGRYVYFVLPNAGRVLLYDIEDKIWQPEQSIQASSMTFIGGKPVAHSSIGEFSFNIFTESDTDLGSHFEAVIKTGQKTFGSPFNKKNPSVSGHIIKAKKDSNFDISYIKDSGYKGGVIRSEIQAKNLTTFTLEENQSRGIRPFGLDPFGIDNLNDTPPLLKSNVYKKFTNNDDFYTMEIEILIKQGYFELVSSYYDVNRSTSKIDEHFFVK